MVEQAEAMRATVASMLRGIERYNPENISTLERYVELQARENTYDLEANLALLKLYQFNPGKYQNTVACTILMKALTNLPHTDFVLCKCLLGQEQMDDIIIKRIMYLHDLLEMCQFNMYWKMNATYSELITDIKDFHDSIRKYICHVITITYQHIEKNVLAQLLGGIDEVALQHWMTKYGWKETDDGYVFIANQEETVKTKNITEKIEFDSVAGIMAACR
ncbi:eukaryotic translation initiation factor 3 subunit K [Procambarus clarkii]|uniref:Eukaryotic translation initiation factor 3 subunit K n=1 Tax=Procambarus clarkii TaxID=6728 RepID=F5A6C9_PROCL|nr:eukaryotic translation initiation factor 3 subunit K-like [Procambarus clarkii]AEB54635.1 eukaryotic translation initiation factor 3 subunit 12 [Procambarus clarkii]